MALTDKQKRFVDEYMIDMNAAAAYLRAGYDCNEATARANASRLLTNANIVAEIDKRQQKLQEDAGISAKWVLDNLKYVAERCMAPEPMVDKEGNIVDWRFDSSVSNKAIERIGRNLGMFNDKLKVDATVTKKLEEFFS